jgi:hypothetical protein
MHDARTTSAWAHPTCAPPLGLKTDTNPPGTN